MTMFDKMLKIKENDAAVALADKLLKDAYERGESALKDVTDFVYGLYAEQGPQLQRRIEPPGAQGLCHDQLAVGVGHDVPDTVGTGEAAPLGAAQSDLADLLTVSRLNHRYRSIPRPSPSARWTR